MYLSTLKYNGTSDVLEHVFHMVDGAYELVFGFETFDYLLVIGLLIHSLLNLGDKYTGKVHTV